MGYVKIDPKWLTADAARKITGINAEDYVTELLEVVKVAAEHRKYELKTTDSVYQLPWEFWSKEAYHTTPKYMRATNILIDLGYEIEIVGANLEECHTVVSWRDNI